ncbi:MAG: type II toxin-antitoxin system PemK/MazF family toxin [Sulfurovum sp.]
MENFDRWNGIKKSTEKEKNNIKLGIRPRDIFWAKIGQNIGTEEYGKNKNFSRPLIVIRKLTSDLFIGIPVTSTIKNNDYFHSFEYENRANGVVTNSAMILQVKTYSIKRLMNKAGVINKNDFAEIIEKSKKLFD